MLEVSNPSISSMRLTSNLGVLSKLPNGKKDTNSGGHCDDPICYRCSHPVLPQVIRIGNIDMGGWSNRATYVVGRSQT